MKVVVVTDGTVGVGAVNVIGKGTVKCDVSISSNSQILHAFKAPRPKHSNHYAEIITLEEFYNGRSYTETLHKLNCVSRIFIPGCTTSLQDKRGNQFSVRAGLLSHKPPMN